MTAIHLYKITSSDFYARLCTYNAVHDKQGMAAVFMVQVAQWQEAMPQLNFEFIFALFKGFISAPGRDDTTLTHAAMEFVNASQAIKAKKILRCLETALDNGVISLDVGMRLPTIKELKSLGKRVNNTKARRAALL